MGKRLLVASIILYTYCFSQLDLSYSFKNNFESNKFQVIIIIEELVVKLLTSQWYHLMLQVI